MTSSQPPRRTEIASLGEFGLIDKLVQNFPIRHASTLKGIGDDAAVVSHGPLATVVTTDLLIEGIHFDLSYVPLKHLGWKSVIVNLSDVYAMNARPKQITVSIAVSNRFSVEALDELYDGIRAACAAYDVDLIGGDTTASPSGLLISVTALGEQAKDKIVYRSGAKPGDLLCATGDFGAAYIGLQVLEREKQLWQNQPSIQPELEANKYAIGRQLKPEARRDAIEAFEKIGLLPTSMIDVSDGLASETLHLCKNSGVGAILEESGVAIRQEVEMQAIAFRLDPITCALSGGEDYELLFTVDPKDIEKVRYLPDIYIAGEIVEQKDGARLATKGGNFHPLTAQGWTHF